MLLRVAHGKGARERLVPLSPRLLQALRGYWKQVRSPKYLFPGKTFAAPLCAATIQKSCKAAAAKAGTSPMPTNFANASARSFLTVFAACIARGF